MNRSGVQAEQHAMMTEYDKAVLDLHSAIFTKRDLAIITPLQREVVIARNKIVAVLKEVSNV